MKQITGIFFVGLMFTFSANAQKNESGNFNFGVKAGLNFSNMKASGQGVSVSYSSLTSFTGGAYAQYKFSECLGIQSELIYNGQGAKYSGIKDEFGYLSLPVLFKYTVPNSGFGIYAGPQISLVLNAKEKSDSLSASVDIKDQLKSTDFSGVIGVDYTFGFGLNIAARYQLGFANIAKGLPSGYSLKISSFGVTLGYKIR
jgi:hypothetical protein